MKDPGLLTAPDCWVGQVQIQNVLDYIDGGSTVGLVRERGEDRGTMEVFAVIVPIEQYRRMTDGGE